MFRVEYERDDGSIYTNYPEQLGTAQALARRLSKRFDTVAYVVRYEDGNDLEQWCYWNGSFAGRESSTT